MKAAELLGMGALATAVHDTLGDRSFAKLVATIRKNSKKEDGDG